MIIYLHGFNSSPASFKARLIEQRLRALGAADQFRAPLLGHWPAAAIAVAEAEINSHRAETVTLVGSSLGGFYATCLAERHGVKAVLVNPAVAAHEVLRTQLGPQKNLYTGEVYEFGEEHLRQLQRLDVAAITRPERYLLLAASGDESLDYRHALAKYAGARQIIVAGGDHGLSSFADYLDEVVRFSGLSAPAPPSHAG